LYFCHFNDPLIFYIFISFTSINSKLTNAPNINTNGAYCKPIIILIACFIIFAFITHLGQSFLANLVVRFPFGLVSGFIYYKTGKLIYPVLLHLLYNAMIV